MKYSAELFIGLLFFFTAVGLLLLASIAVSLHSITKQPVSVIFAEKKNDETDERKIIEKEYYDIISAAGYDAAQDETQSPPIQVPSTKNDTGNPKDKRSDTKIPKRNR